ncbi:MAG: DUF4097 family beta strand repeat protein [Clostridia bacterium]|nr:DUF4097 family beta strand repeat protein [Clostridia bacterium]
MKKGIAALVGAAVAASALFTACSLPSSVTDYLFPDEKDYTEYSGEKIEIENDEALSLDLDWVAGEIEIREGEKLTVTEENLKGTYYPLYYTVKDGALCVKFCKSGTLGRVIDGCSKKVIVTLPEGMNDIKVNSVSAKVYVEYGKKLENVTVNSVSGDVTASVGKVDKFTSDVVSAAAVIITFEAEEITSNAVSGNVRILGDPKEVKTHSVSGDSHIYAGNKDLKSVKIDTISGDAEIMLDGTRDYSLEYNTVSGKLTNDVGEIKNVTGDKIEIKMDSVSGDLRFMKTAD